jgi:tape measure domain-containing protein
MSVVANVVINVDASKALQQIKGVDTAVGGLAKNAAAVPGKISGGLDGLGNKLQTLGGKFATFGGAIASLGAGAALKGFLDAGIAADRTGKTITALAGSYKEVAGVNKIANAAAKEFGLGQTTAAKSVADLYGRLRPMGISLDNIGKTFNGVNKAAGLMNLSAADTEGVMLQLSQAMGSGALQGDELRSIMERLPAVGQAVAKVMGVTVGEVKKLGSDGKITTDVIIKAMEELNKLKPPPADAVKLYTAAMEDLQTSIGTKLLPVFTPFLQALTKLIEGFSALPQPLQNVIVGIGGLLAVVTLIAAPLGFLISGIGTLMTALAAAKVGATIAGWAALAGPAITAISAAFSGLLAFLTGTLLPGLIAFFSGPVGWTVLAVAAVVAMAILFRKPLQDFATWLVSWAKPIGQFFTVNVTTPISKAWQSMVEFLPKALNTAAATIKSVFTGVGTAIKAVLNGVLRGVFGAVNGAIENINRLVRTANAISAKVRGPQLPTLPTLSVPQFAKGGYVGQGTLAVVGEAGPEYIIPASKMAAASANYLKGARGGAVIPAYASGGYVGGGNAQINVTTGPVLQQGNQQYVTMADLERAMRKTADGVYSSLRTPAGRYAVGVR